MACFAVLISVVAAALTPAAAFATCGNTHNCFGIYFDEAAENYCLYPCSAFTLYRFYFVIKSCDIDRISGCEFAWRLDPMPSPGPVVSTVALAGDVSTPVDPYNVIARFDEPVLGSDPLILARMDLLFLANVGQIMLYTGPSDPATVATRAVVFAGEDFANPVPLELGVPTSTSGWADDPVAGLNSWWCEPDPVEPVTWSSIKALYR